MKIDEDNPIVQLCGKGMLLEGEAKYDEAHQLFLEAWEKSQSHFEKAISAHYVARNQGTTESKLEWDLIALDMALSSEEDIVAMLPSLYLNIGKGYEDLGQTAKATEHYETGLKRSKNMADDGYARMIISGIIAGLERIKALD